MLSLNPSATERIASSSIRASLGSGAEFAASAASSNGTPENWPRITDSTPERRDASRRSSLPAGPCSRKSMCPTVPVRAM